MRRRTRRRVMKVMVAMGVMLMMAVWWRHTLIRVIDRLPELASAARGIVLDQLRGSPPKKTKKRYTIHDRLEQHGDKARRKLGALFERAGVAYPPERLVLVGLKKERRLLVYADDGEGMRFIKAYPIRAASGTLGPKRREGDFQVPEGLYNIDFFNPNSSNHLSMRVTYPSADDRLHAKRERRKGSLGGEIYIHGKWSSAGCLAMGDRAIEEIWVMAVDTGKRNIDVILSPVDFRVRRLPKKARNQADWVLERYTAIREALEALPPARLAPRRSKAGVKRRPRKK
ncbi:MAG: L,D-transpeptidase family protein [Myxococcota bacterium]